MNPLRQPPRRYDYVTDGQEIYRRSFGMIRDEAVQPAADLRRRPRQAILQLGKERHAGPFAVSA